MREYLVFQLYGLLASWGDIAVGRNPTVRADPGQVRRAGPRGRRFGAETPRHGRKRS